jgi:hypothetical protein
MPIGNNAGGQLNLIMFELGMMTRDPFGSLPDLTRTIAVHPMVVVPSSIKYRDTSRGSVQETHDAAVLTIAGRAARELDLSGTFGVESRGLGPYIGTGELRFQRFYHEVVRLADAVTKAQVDAEKNPFRSPILSLQLKTYNPDLSSFFLNYYDLWHDISFAIQIPSFSWTRGHTQGGAVGMTHYQLNGREAGPIVTGGIGTSLLKGLFDVLTTWDQINELVKSYTLEAVTASLGAAVGVVTGQAADSFNAILAQVNSKAVGVTRLLAGFQTEPRQGEVTDTDSNDVVLDGYADYLGTSNDLAVEARAMADRVASIAPAALANPPGQVPWSTTLNEGQIDALEAAEQRELLHGVADAAAFQLAAGAFFGMGREEYAEWLGSNTRSGRGPNLKGSIQHTVTAWDSPNALESLYGVKFDVILALNQLLPDEALSTGRVLQIPRERTIGVQSQIDGLPVFGSHAGREAWGRDLAADLRVDSEGRFVILSDEDILVQGMEWLIAQFGDELMEFIAEVPDVPGVPEALLRQRLTSIFLSDRRFSDVAELSVVVNEDGLIEVESSVTAINGEEISTGGA